MALGDSTNPGHREAESPSVASGSPSRGQCDRSLHPAHLPAPSEPGEADGPGRCGRLSLCPSGFSALVIFITWA